MGKRSALFTLRLLSEGTDLGGSLLRGKSNLPQRYPHHAMIHRQTVHTCTFAFVLRRRGDGAAMPCRRSPRHFVLWTRPPLPLVQRRTHPGTHSLLYVSGSGVWGVAGVALGLA